MSQPIDFKTQKYDRQLRLWATTGQQALEEAHVCLLNVTSTGCEILKNLVLPGVGNVTLIDDRKVSYEEISTNFFLDPESENQSKARSAADLLKELNEDTKVSFLEKDPSALIHTEIELLDTFNIIIAVNLSNSDNSFLASRCQDKALFIVKSKGLVGMFSIQAPEHTIIESHPENAMDLRLNSPFSELVDHVASYNLDSLDQTDHSHVPFIIILLKYVEAYKVQFGQPPQSYQDRKKLIELIHQGMREPDEENFHEAVSHVWRLSSNPQIPSEVKRIFDSPSCQNANENSSYFWILAKAVHEFVENEGQGQLPLSGKLPDMKSDTTKYIDLQNVYRQKALSDLDAVKKRVCDLINNQNAVVSEEMIQTFCKNAAHIKVISYRSFEKYYEQTDKIAQWIKEEENFCYVLMFKAADQFQILNGHYPACDSDLKEQTEILLKGMKIPSENIQPLIESDAMKKACFNFTRFTSGEAPNIAALLGGLVSQEIIKIITHQYVPINNTCIFNGITATSNVFEL